MNFEKISLVFMFICIIALFVENQNIKKNFKNLENFSNQNIVEHASNTEDIKNLINEQYSMDVEAIRNLGAISKSLLTGKNYHNTTGTTPGDLIIPANVKIQGWAVAVPVGTVIMWSMETPPSPNTKPYNYRSVTEGYTLADTDCWYPCIGGTVNGVNIPNLLGRMVVGQGIINNDPNYVDPNHVYNYAILNSAQGGIVPVGRHKHTIGGMTRNEKHKHSMEYNPGGYNAGRIQSTDRGSWGGINTSETNTNHEHTMGHPNDTINNSRTDYFNRHTIPHSTVLQFWIRVR